MYRMYALLEGRGACADLQKPIRMLCKVIVPSRDDSAHPAISATTRVAFQRPSDRLKCYRWPTPRPLCVSTRGSFHRRSSSFRGRLRVGLIHVRFTTPRSERQQHCIPGAPLSVAS